MNNKVFISGKISGDPGYKLKFAQASLYVTREDFYNTYGREKMQRAGYNGFESVCPPFLTLFGLPLERYCWTACMFVCLRRLLRCSYVYMLNDWASSRGSRIEHAVAKLTRKRIIYQRPGKPQRRRGYFQQHKQ